MNLLSILDHIRHFLPAQGPIKDFIHHNTLHAFQDKPFEQAVLQAGYFYGAHTHMPLTYYRAAYAQGKISKKALQESAQQLGVEFEQLFDYVDTKEEKKQERQNSEWDGAINPILFRLTSGFLDQGIGIWAFPSSELSFWECIRKLAQESFFPIASFVNKKSFLSWLEKTPEEAAVQLLHHLVGDEEKYEAYIMQTLMAHPGWSGMVNVLEHKPSSLFKNRSIRLVEFLALKLVLEWEWISASGNPPTPFSKGGEKSGSQESPFEKGGKGDFSPSPQNTISLAWQRALENTYYEEVLSGLHTHVKKTGAQAIQNPSLQAVFCIDDRECSFRRYLEEFDPSVETFATAGFFGLDFYFQSLNDAFPIQSCPVLIKPRHLVKEIPAQGHQEAFEKQKQQVQKTALSLRRWNEGSSSMIWGFVASNTLGHLSIFKLINCFLNPKKLIESLVSKKITIPTELTLVRDESTEANKPLLEGFTYEEMANRVESVFKSMGLTHDFSKLVVMIAHGSSSINNPHFAAYDCGACSGKPGAPNARAFAAIANLPQVREILDQRGLHIPNETKVLGAYHDTCTDEVVFFDEGDWTPDQKTIFSNFKNTLQKVRVFNAKERCRRFEAANLSISPQKALEEVLHRSSALFEPRPELGHATNTLCVVGRRSLTRGLFLDRRAFLNSYDPAFDPSGQILNQILNAVVPVCGGITLEYYFSRLDAAVYGCGTKLSHNVCGLLGVGNGVDDDLRTGLPVQMTEIHDPIRLLIIVDQKPDIVMQVLSKNAPVHEWIKNDWVKMACMDPENQDLSFYESGVGFKPYAVPAVTLPVIMSLETWVSQSRKNLPVAEMESL